MAVVMTDRAPIVGYAQYDGGSGRVDFEIGWPEFDRDTAWARRLVPAAGIGRGEHVLFTLRNSEGPWTSPLIRAIRDSGAISSNAEPYSWDARRCAAFLRSFPVAAMVGLSSEIAEALLAEDETAKLLAKVPLVWARPDAVGALREAGLRPAVLAMLGPALGAECRERSGLHLDPGEWLPRRSAAGLTLDVVGDRVHRSDGIALALDGRIDEAPCPCGLPGPRIVADGLD
jgi:hypothetical protein